MLLPMFVATALFIQGSTASPQSPSLSQPSDSVAVASNEVSTVSPLVVTPTAPKRKQADPNELLCHDELPPGTRFAIKVCARRSEFAERTRQSQDMVREMQRAVISRSQ